MDQKYEKNKILQKLENIPDKPGCYQFYDDTETIIYVGKAKSLRKRVASYFYTNLQSGKTKVLVRKIEDIQFIVVNSEQDALLLENSLIKEYQPRYNVLLKDDKTYPWIVIKNEPFPRVFKTRNYIEDGSIYFGPYSSGVIVNTLIDLVKHLHRLRTCSFTLSDDTIAQKKIKPCLEFHIGNCLAPCIGLQTKADYDNNILQIRDILKGNLTSVKNHLKGLMAQFSEKMEFEKAEEIRQKYLQIEKFQSKSMVVNASISNVDVFTIINDENFAFVNFLKIMDGSILQSYNLEIRKRIDESKEDLLLLAIVDIRKRVNSFSKEVLVPFSLNIEIDQFQIVVPIRGDKKKLIELSEQNAKYFRLEKLKQQLQLNPQQRGTRVLQTLKTDLQLDELPVHIECFDNSNTQGTDPVAACVVFKNGKPAKKDYRHFNIKTVEGPNDFASMEEVVFRRYRRLLDEEGEIPQLIVVDGGKGQLSSAVSALEKLDFKQKPAIIGIAKRLEEIFFPGDSVPIYLDKNSESLKLIQQLRDEAHRFGITHHRKKRSKHIVVSELDSIKGLGPKTISTLLSHFGSFKNLSTKTENEISEIVGNAKAKIIFDYINFKANGN